MSSVDTSTAFSSEQMKHAVDAQLSYDRKQGMRPAENEKTQMNGTTLCCDAGTDSMINEVKCIGSTNGKEEQTSERCRKQVKTSKYDKNTDRKRIEQDASSGIIKEKEMNGYQRKSVDIYKKEYGNIYNSVNGINGKRGHRELKRNDTSNYIKSVYGNDTGIVTDANSKKTDFNSLSKGNMSERKNKVEILNGGNFVNSETNVKTGSSFGRTGNKQEVNNYGNNDNIKNLNGKGHTIPMPANFKASINGNYEINANKSIGISVDSKYSVPPSTNSKSPCNYSSDYPFNSINSNTSYSNNTCSNSPKNFGTNTNNNADVIANSSTATTNTNTDNATVITTTNTNNTSNNSITTANTNDSGTSIANYNGATNYSSCGYYTEGNDKNYDCRAYYTPALYNTCYSDGIPGINAAVSASTTGTTEDATAATLVGAGGGQYDCRYTYVMNDYCNYYPYNGNYYCYNGSNSYYSMNLGYGNMHGINGNAVSISNPNLSYIDPLKAKKEKELPENQSNVVTEGKDGSNIYEELKNRVVDIFKRENMMTDEYLLYYVCNNVKLNLNIIAKHPFISSIVGNDLNVLQDVLNDLKHYDVVATENGENKNNHFVGSPTLKVMYNEKEKAKGSVYFYTGRNIYAQEQDKIVTKKSERENEPNAADVNEKREDNVGNNTNEMDYVITELIKGNDDKNNQKTKEDIEKMVKHVNQETKANDAIELKTEINGVQDTVDSSVKATEENLIKPCNTPLEGTKPNTENRASEEDNKDFLLNLNNKRNTIIIRDIYSYFIDKIKELVYNCPHVTEEEIMNIKNECNNTIFITLKNDKKTEALAQYLKDQTVGNSKLNVRIKSIQKIQNIIENNMIKKTVSINCFGGTLNSNGTNLGTFTKSVCGGSIMDGCVSFPIDDKSVTNKPSSVIFLNDQTDVASRSIPSETVDLNTKNCVNCATEIVEKTTSNNYTLNDAAVSNSNSSPNINSNNTNNNDNNKNTNDGDDTNSNKNNNINNSNSNSDNNNNNNVAENNNNNNNIVNENNNSSSNNRKDSADGSVGHETVVGNVNMPCVKKECENVPSGGVSNVNMAPVTEMRTTNGVNNYYLIPNNVAMAYHSSMCANNTANANTTVPGTTYDPLMNYYHYTYSNAAYGCNMYYPLNACDTYNTSMYNSNTHNSVLPPTFSANGEMMKNKGNFEKGNNCVRDEQKMLNPDQGNARNCYLNTYMYNGYPNNYGNMYAMNYVNTGMYPYNFTQAYYHYNVPNIYGHNFKGLYNGIYNEDGYGGAYNSQTTNPMNNIANNNNTNVNISNNHLNNNSNNDRAYSNHHHHHHHNSSSVDNNRKTDINGQTNKMVDGEHKEDVKGGAFSDETERVGADMPNEKQGFNGTRLRKNGRRENAKGTDYNTTNAVVKPPVGQPGTNNITNGCQNNTTATGSTASNSASRFVQRNGKPVIISNNIFNGGFTKGGKMKFNRRETTTYDKYVNKNNMNGYGNRWNNYFSNRRGDNLNYERKAEVEDSVNRTCEMNETKHSNEEREVTKDGFNFSNPEIAQVKRGNDKKLAAERELRATEVESVQEKNEVGDDGDEDGKQQSKHSHLRDYANEKGSDKKRASKMERNRSSNENHLSNSSNTNNGITNMANVSNGMNNNNNSNNNNSTNNRKNEYGHYQSYNTDRKDFGKNYVTHNNTGGYNTSNHNYSNNSRTAIIGNNYSGGSNNSNGTSRKSMRFYQNKYNNYFEDRRGYRRKNSFDSNMGNNIAFTTNVNNNNISNGIATSNNNENNNSMDKSFRDKENVVANDSIDKNNVIRNDVANNVSEIRDVSKNDSTCNAYVSVNSNTDVPVKKASNEVTKNGKKYSFVDIVDSCKKIEDVKTPECIDNLIKENVSLFRKRDEQFCWKLNVC